MNAGQPEPFVEGKGGEEQLPRQGGKRLIKVHLLRG
jgi:hypothetical protein